MTPTTTKALLEAGFKVNVERSPERIFGDDEFSAVGATLVPEGSWPSVPKDNIIIGLKELPEETCMALLFISLPFSSTTTDHIFPPSCKD